MVLADLNRVYPLLTDTRMTCQGAHCTLRGTIDPMTSQADLDKRQEMLVGGLAAVLAADGYRMPVPFRMDEVGDNIFHITATVEPVKE